MDKKGIALIFALFVVTVLLILGGAGFVRSASENLIVNKYMESTQAFWLAEAGINEAVNAMRSNFNVTAGEIGNSSLGNGGYDIVSIENITSTSRKVTVKGFTPATGTINVERIIEVIMNVGIPPNFYGNAIYSAGDVNLNGDSYVINGDVLYADEIDNTGNVNGTVTQDPSISPLARFDFEQLRALSEAQGNVYDAERLASHAEEDDFPETFWHDEPSDPTDPLTGTPNIVYIETDLQLNGNIGNVGGFFVVAGDVITNPDESYDATINGNGEIDGVIYTRGEFRINGGAGGLNIDGGVWAGEEARMNGNCQVDYNEDYMRSIQNLEIDTEAQITSWKEVTNPYPLDPEAE
ncbi:MAG: pilus assembly PilX N-terminal domain-containing protein [Candidatus Omnitrophica bacterium]|nr:pilus assembly PilX N-terminal domain-containing protein [Candidatus Omnitrophota bacterium]